MTEKLLTGTLSLNTTNQPIPGMNMSGCESLEGFRNSSHHGEVIREPVFEPLCSHVDLNSAYTTTEKANKNRSENH